MGSLRSLRRRDVEPVPPLILCDEELNQAVQFGTFKQVEALLERGANPNAADIYANTALGHAVHLGKLKMAQVLVKNGADVNRKNHLGIDPLTIAVASPWSTRQKICRLLLDNRADVNASKCYGNTPLMVAAIFQRFDLAKLLLEKGADATQRNHDGKRALDILRRGKGSTALRKLLEPVS